MCLLKASKAVERQKWEQASRILDIANPAVTVPPLVADKVDELVGRPNDLSETKTGD
jgi:hypothetical protein